MNSNKLKELIKKAQGNRTQNQFALHCGISSAALSRFFNNERVPAPLTLKKIAEKAYNDVTYEQLLEAAGYIDDNVLIAEDFNIKVPTNKLNELWDIFKKTGIDNLTIKNLNKNQIEYISKMIESYTNLIKEENSAIKHNKAFDNEQQLLDIFRQCDLGKQMMIIGYAQGLLEHDSKLKKAEDIYNSR